MERERYYVQVARTSDPLAVGGYGGWQTMSVWLDCETAEADAGSHERAVLFIDGRT
jgi:hypothetical protein